MYYGIQQSNQKKEKNERSIENVNKRASDTQREHFGVGQGGAKQTHHPSLPTKPVVFSPATQKETKVCACSVIAGKKLK